MSVLDFSVLLMLGLQFWTVVKYVDSVGGGTGRVLGLK